MVPFVWAVIASFRRPMTAGADPWHANSLEWATSSPPPPHNFVWLPPIRSERPVFDLRWINHEDVSAIGTSQAWRARADHDTRWIPLHQYDHDHANEPTADSRPSSERTAEDDGTTRAGSREDRSDHVGRAVRLLRRPRRHLLGRRRGPGGGVAAAHGHRARGSDRRVDVGLAAPPRPPPPGRPGRRRRRGRDRRRRRLPDGQRAPAGPRRRRDGHRARRRDRVVDAAGRRGDHASPRSPCSRGTPTADARVEMPWATSSLIARAS